MAMRFASLLPAKVIRFSLRPVFLRDVFNDTKKMRRFPGKNVTAEQIAACAQKAEAAGIDTSSPNISIGTWYDKNSDTTFLDVSLTTADRERAIALAQQFRQKNAIPIGGTGEALAGLPSIEDRLKILSDEGQAPPSISQRAPAQAASLAPRRRSAITRTGRPS
jgi:hypothetical protein